ncbi:hypothetical protein B0X71_02645 [Planococcus lenghuensis]|uniref:Uncharacterized protein n=1 Tax=Planococcus lenghuensis TaxID=2213202 RepID=A0A1Q2KVC1_9BACL|nr:hypothetical protein B0X71_02645 [Planococcus lenghuensis]
MKFAFICLHIHISKNEVNDLAKEKEIRNIASNLAKLGIPVKLTKSRVDILKALVPPAQVPPVHS